ncbi:MAG: EAL domain-containing protein [Gammaproteobacteria bacterium SHHR-1]
MAKKAASLFAILATLTISIVGLIMALHGLHSYDNTKQRLQQQLIWQAQRDLQVMAENISAPMEAYAVNEYQKLVANKLRLSGGLAILVDDLKMGQIMGQSSYRSGYVRTPGGELREFKPNHPEHQALLDASFYSQRQGISDAEGKLIGWVNLYASGEELQAQLDQLLLERLIDSLALSCLLIIALFLAIRMLLVRPLLDMVRGINDADADGIPRQPVGEDGPREIQQLAQTINHMLSAIDRSRRELRLEHQALERERERFQLAVEGSHDGTWDWDMRTNRLYKSSRFTQMLGYQPEDLPDTIEAWSSLIHPDDQEQAHQQVKDYLDARGQGVYESTFRMRTQDGQWRWITGRGKAVFAEDGTPLRFVGFNTDVTRQIRQQQELQEQKQLLQYQANHDALTGLANRSLFSERLEQAIARARRGNLKLALLFIDLDHFKEVNDSLGHRTGDKVLSSVSQRLQQSIRAEDTLGRLGGDEFAILMEDITQEQDASIRAEAILEAIARPFRIDEHEFYLGSSIGISIFPDNGLNARDLLKNADAALFKAKNEGRNNFQYYSAEMTTLAFERLQLETALRLAVANEEFVVYYQPQIDMAQNRIVGAEALVRWQHPSMGLVSPARFIPIAESSGLIVDIDRLVMRMAMRQLVDWHRQGLAHGSLALNLSVKHVHRKDFISSVVEALVESHCDPAWLEFEVTETQVMDNPEEAISMLYRLDNLGIRLALDDFGTGHSSLAYLKRMPISKLKIDQSFVRDLPDDAEDAAISKAVIALAQSLNLDLLAEGIENQQQIDFMLQQGCHKAQGYFYARPLPAEEMTAFYTNWPRRAQS